MIANILSPRTPLLALAATIAGAPGALGAGTTVAGTFGDWNLHVNESAGTKICFAASEPKEKNPAGTNRATVIVYVSAWPKDGVKSEVSVKLGYPVKAATSVALVVGKDEFKLFAKEERAYVEDAALELKLIEAMKKAPTLIVKATSERGTATTDTYSLAGFALAMQAMATACK